MERSGSERMQIIYEGKNRDLSNANIMNMYGLSPDLVEIEKNGRYMFVGQ